MSHTDAPVGVGIIGFGTVGQGTYTILRDNAPTIARQVGVPVEPRMVADIRAAELAGRVGPGVQLVSDARQVLESPDVQIVCELIGGVGVAADIVRQALTAGKHVVTANKELLARQGPELLRLAEENGCDFYFEASVGGGIPIISPLRVGLAGNRVERILGIVNGTTNYILTAMASGGGDLPSVLREAQELGYAEADPTNDVEGFDARYKLTILASLGFQARVQVEQILCEGITRLVPQDIEYARELGYGVKLLAIARRIDGRIEARVHPTLVPFSHPIASVAGVNNAIYVTGNAVGDTMFFGPGAGGLAAGSAVVGDIIEIARNIRAGSCGRLRCPEFRDLPVLPADDITARYYVRMRVKDAPGVLAAIASEFGAEGVSIAAVIQKDSHEGVAEIIFLTHGVREKSLRDALEKIERLPVVEQVCAFIRVEE